jgi:hypothetical protein
MGKLILISGKIKSGKDIFLEAATAKFGSNVVRVGFSDKLKEMAASVTGEDVSLFNSQEGKAGLLGKMWVNPSGERMTRREFLQRFGTQVRLGVCPEFWINDYQTRIEKVWDVNPDAIILTPDTRFFNEADCARKNDGLLLRICRNYTWNQFCEAYGIGTGYYNHDFDDRRTPDRWTMKLDGLCVGESFSNHALSDALRSIKHRSETELDAYLFSNLIENHGSLDNYEMSIETFLNKF